MPDIDFTSLDAPPWAVIGLVTLGGFALMMGVKRIILGRIRRLSDRSSFTLDTMILESIGFPLTLVSVTLALYLLRYMLSAYGIGDTHLISQSNVIGQLMLVAAIIVFADQFSSRALESYSSRSEALRTSGGILKGVSRGLIIGIGVLVILGTLGISVTPIIASLGITSLAVALALQPTLENFFSGVQIVVDKPFRVGDYIELDSGEQGFVEKIGWRSTWIKMLPNNTVIVPNSVISQSKLVNYFYPAKELSVPVEVGVHYDSDLEHVERVTLEVARHILKTHKWGVPEYDTFVVYTAFDSSSINFTVMLRAQEYFNRFFIKSEFMKALHKRYKEEGIVIPYPIRAINYSQENAKMAAESDMREVPKD